MTNTDIFEEPHYTVICDQQQVFTSAERDRTERNSIRKTELKETQKDRSDKFESKDQTPNLK